MSVERTPCRQTIASEVLATGKHAPELNDFVCSKVVRVLKWIIFCGTPCRYKHIHIFDSILLHSLRTHSVLPESDEESEYSAESSSEDDADEEERDDDDSDAESTTSSKDSSSSRGSGTRGKGRRGTRGGKMVAKTPGKPGRRKARGEIEVVR